MPFTLSHPVAALPFARWAPRYLDFAAMVIGSVTPDMAYFLHNNSVASHTFAGSFTFCLPVGLVLFLGYLIFRAPICRLLPSPHREALLPLAETPVRWNFLRLLIVVFSILLGAWTHLFLDGFTHRDGFFVRTIPFLTHSAVFSPTIIVPYYIILQQIFTTLGAGILIAAYIVWLRRKNIAPYPVFNGWRRNIWIVLCILPLLLSAWTVRKRVWASAEWAAWYNALCHFALYSMGFFFALLLIFSLIFSLRSSSARVMGPYGNAVK